MPLTLSFAFFKNGFMNFFNTTPFCSSLLEWLLKWCIFGVGISLGFRDMGSTISCSFVLRHIKNIKSNFRCQEHCMGSKECKLIK